MTIHAYCWMTNHIHALVEVGPEPLGRFMQRVASQYARFVQRRGGTTGHLFERRYHAVLVDSERYLLALVRYIHLNPVKSGRVLGDRDFVSRLPAKPFMQKPTTTLKQLIEARALGRSVSAISQALAKEQCKD